MAGKLAVGNKRPPFSAASLTRREIWHEDARLFVPADGLYPNQVRDDDRADEIEANLQLHIDDNLRQGMTPEQARRAAILKLED